MFVRTEQNYTKKKGNITRIDWDALDGFLRRHLRKFKICNMSKEVRVFVERPYVNPKGFKATASALRALEATLIVIELIGLSYEYIDSRQWQRKLLPKGLKGTPELKKASMDIGIRLFPEFVETIRKHKDADSLLIAEWARRNNL
jgi:hypothetical protein